MWPFTFVLNELPPEKRLDAENVILGGLWFGTKKPNFNIFLKYMQNQVKKMGSGLQVKVPGKEDPVTVKSFVVGLMVDIPAVAQCSNMKQHNGEFGCHFCYAQGKHVGNTRVYPYAKRLLRSDVETIEFAIIASETGNAVYGVKKPSTLADIIWGGKYVTRTAVDAMHNIFEGHVKHMMRLMTSTKYSKKPWSLRGYLKLMDNRLEAMEPPSGVERLPRGIEENFNYWKANECKAWLFYYSLPIISDLLPPEYLELYNSFVYACAILCSDSISTEDLEKAKEASDEYEKEFQRLYGEGQMRMNVHLLGHLVDNVRKFGPLWTTSCFRLEDFLGKMARKVHGSKSPQLQVIRAMSIYLNFCRMKRKYIRKGTKVYEVSRNAQTKNHQLNMHAVGTDTFIVGTYNLISRDSLPMDMASALDKRRVVGTRYCLFYRLYKNKTLFMSQSYKRVLKTNSTYASYTNNGKVEIGIVQSFVRVLNCECDPINCDCSVSIYALLKQCTIEKCFFTEHDESVPHMYKEISAAQDLTAVTMEKLKAVCFSLVPTPGECRYIAEPVNMAENE